MWALFSIVIRAILLSALLLYAGSVRAQRDPTTSFNFLKVPANARLAALGGVNVSLADRDINLYLSNPALVSDTLQRVASLNYQLYVGDVNQTSFAYGHKLRKVGLVTFGVQHLSYGTIKTYDATGNPTGEFSSGETGLYISNSHQSGNFRFGGTLKAAFSSIAGYRASSVLLDIGGVFVHPEKNITVGLAMKNLGFKLRDYTGTSSSSLPLDIQVGTTIKPEHMPLRFSITAYNLVYTAKAMQDTTQAKTQAALDKVLRRFNFAVEILLHKHVNVLVGYNYQQHQELKLPSGGGGAGLTFGFSAVVKSAELVFSRSGFVAGRAGYTFTVSVHTDKIIKRK